jgi:dihydroneopterin aldolase
VSTESPTVPPQPSLSSPAALLADTAADLDACPDTIFIRSLAVSSRIGVTASERAFPQRLLLDIEIVPKVPFAQMADALEETVDYAAVSQEIIGLCAEKERKLLESLAVHCADHILQHHPVHRVLVRIRKFILPETEYVAVEHRQTRRAAPPLVNPPLPSPPA